MVVIFAVGIHDLPSPIYNDDGHYADFYDVYGQSPTEDLIPSNIQKKNKKTLPFNATQQHVRNVNLLIQCEECKMWRLLFLKKKLSKNLEGILEDLSYTCGATFDDLDLQKSVCIRLHSCFDPIKKLYYSSGFEPICFYCAESVESSEDEEPYPQCGQCLTRPRVKKINRAKK